MFSGAGEAFGSGLRDCDPVIGNSIDLSSTAGRQEPARYPSSEVGPTQSHERRLPIGKSRGAERLRFGERAHLAPLTVQDWAGG